jgi:hypothetical protein
MKNQKNMKSTEATDNNAKCVGIHELIDWQIIQYRKAVDAHRLDLSKVEGRCVAWQDAEQDFNSHDRESISDKSRGDYCDHVCPSRENCLIALQFLSSRHTHPLYRAG